MNEAVKGGAWDQCVKTLHDLLIPKLRKDIKAVCKDEYDVDEHTRYIEDLLKDDKRIRKLIKEYEDEYGSILERLPIDMQDRDIMEFTADNLMDMTKDALKQLIQDKGVDRL
jgi:hypothetical protein